MNMYLLAYQKLAGLALAEGRALWKLRPKYHYMAHHAIDLARPSSGQLAWEGGKL
jgi:hypothetical protein